jgi:NADPH:quinone reductase-like Zn-dependent oxidoreductase/acyl carrier protein
VAANHGRGPARVTLPSYPFQRRHCWLPPRGEATVPATTPSPHPLLGARLQSSLLGSDQSCHAQTFTAARPAWLADHQALGHVLLPAAGMCELALAAARDRGAALPLVAHGVTLRQPLRLDAEPLATELLCQATPTGASFTLKSRDGDEWRLHCDGLLGGTAAEAKALDLTAIRARCPTVLTAAALYAQCTALQLQYGPTFRTVVALQRGDGELLATLRTDADAARACVLHPALLDGAFQTLVAALPPTATPYLPIGIEHLTVHRAGAGQAHCHVRVRPQDGAGQSRIADLTLVDDQGQRLATVRGLQLVPADPATLLQRGAGRELLYHHSFVPAPSATPGPLPARVLVVALLPTAAALAAALGAGLPKGHATVVGVEQLPGALANHRLDHLVLVAAGPDPAPAAGLAATATAWLHAGLATLRAALRTPQPPRPWLVTHGCQAAGPVPAGARPEAAVLLGVFRTLALEHPSLRPVAIDLDPVVPLDDHPTHVATVLTELRTTGDEPELALRGGQRRVLRLLPGAAPGDRLPLPATPFRVRAEAYGGVDQLAIVPIVRRAPGPGEVEVELRAAGLIFKDVLYARGMLASYASAAGVHDATAQPLGFEGTGVVVAVGPDVASPRLHDTVLLVGPDCLGTHTTLPASATCPLPPHIDPIAAAGMPIGFATVWYALVDRAAVQPGETVLVHAAAGGVGQAAIQLVASRGGRVLATASAGKRAFVRALGVEVVGDSRSADFAAAVLAATGGRGVDVVLNTLGGDTIAESLRALRRGGRFVELGKLGVWDQAKMAAVRADVAFTAFDLGDEFARDPALLPRLLGQVVAGLAEGSCRPPTPTVLPLPQVRQAFTHLGKGQHVGKVVVQIPATTDRGARSWLVTGASGGIAPAICHALVEAGARHLALLARSPVQGAWLDELRRRGVQLLPLQADVGDRTALAAALQQVRAALPPLGGIVHAAGALADGLLAGLDAERAAAAATAKLLGARWLDELTADDPITAFVLVSSMAATLGNPGQAAYAGANSYLDAFAAWRRTRGLAATSVAFGPWDGGGMASRLDERHRQRLQQHGVGFLPAALAARLLVAHAQSEPLAVLPVRWADWLRPFGDTPPRPWRELQPAATAAVARTGPLDLLGLPAAARPAALKAAVRRQVATVLGFQNPDQLDPERTFRDLGLDSLLAVDAKDQLERLLGLSLPATLLFDYPDLERLTAHLFACRFPASSRATPPAPAPAASETEGLAQLDTETLARLLAAELQPPRSHHE